MLTSGYVTPKLPYGLLGAPQPIPMVNPQGDFDPRMIAGIGVWFDAADQSTITLNGSSVSQWSDKSGNALHATQDTANNQPAYIPGGRAGRAVVRFDGANDSLVTASFANGWGEFTSFCVFSTIAGVPPGGGIGLQVLWTRSTDRQRGIVVQASSGAVAHGIRGHLNSAGQTDFDSSLFGLFGRYYYLTNRHDGSTISRAAAFTCRANGADIQNTASGSFSVSSVANTVLRIGNRSDGTRGFYGNMCELIVYAVSLPALQVSLVEEYLARKWGL